MSTQKFRSIRDNWNSGPGLLALTFIAFGLVLIATAVARLF